MSKLLIKYNKNGSGLKAICSCGKLIRFAHSCNAAGLKYAEAAAKEDYKKHNCTIEEKQ